MGSGLIPRADDLYLLCDPERDNADSAPKLFQ